MRTTTDQKETGIKWNLSNIFCRVMTLRSTGNLECKAMTLTGSLSRIMKSLSEKFNSF